MHVEEKYLENGEGIDHMTNQHLELDKEETTD